MGDVSETRYATVGDSNVAYKVVGDGPFDLLYFYGLGSHVDLFWDDEGSARWMRSLASFSRVIFFDRRGTGASDRLEADDAPTWEAWTDDVLAVLDDAGSTSAAIFASLDAGPIAVLFATLHPGRVRSLVLANTTARVLADDDYSMGVSREVVEAQIAAVRDLWGKADFVRIFTPAWAEDPAYVEGFTRRLRASATPRAAAAQYRYIMETIDVRELLPLVQVPTLVLHTSDNPVVPVAQGRYLAEHLPDARFVEVPGHGVSLNDGQARDRAIDEIAEFLTGQRPQVEVDRVLTTVLFTDIVGSTRRALELGDAGWHRLLDAHDRAVREELHRFRGREINTTGDGFFASFDGPARAIRCAQAIIEAAQRLGIDVRSGIHTGECELRGDDLAGVAVHIAARIGSLAEAGEVLVSRTVVDLVAGSDIDFADRREQELKGIPGSASLFVVEG